MTIPLVVTGVLISQGRILLQQRSRRRSYPWMWETPGGKVELGESPAAAVFREWQEEIGLAIINPVSIGDREFRVPVVERDFDMLAYLVTSSVHDPEIVHKDAEGIGWFTLSEAYQLRGTPSLKWVLSLVAYNQFLEV